MMKRVTLIVLGLCLLYGSWILGVTAYWVLRAPFEGGRNGPLDAYRHTLASALVSYSLNDQVVRFVTWIMESEEEADNHMDRHNNAIGAQIGQKAESLSEVFRKVQIEVARGTVQSQNSNQITWLPESEWEESWLW